MDFMEAWNKALKQTNIIRTRVQSLRTFEETKIPYILLSESAVNHGDTVVRKGEVVLAKPSLIMPPHAPQFNGFDFEKDDGLDENQFVNFLIIRGVTMPSLNYNNTTNLLDIFEGDIKKAINSYNDKLQQMEDVHSGLLAGPEDCWQFSLLFYVCSQIARNADQDIQRLLKQFKKNRD